MEQEPLVRSFLTPWTESTRSKAQVKAVREVFLTVSVPVHDAMALAHIYTHTLSLALRVRVCVCVLPTRALPVNEPQLFCAMFQGVSLIVSLTPGPIMSTLWGVGHKVKSNQS